MLPLQTGHTNRLPTCGSGNGAKALVMALAATVGMSVHAGEVGQPEPSRVFAPFADLDQTANWPAWVQAWSHDGGALATNATGNPIAWYVPADAPEGNGSIYMLLDRQVLTNDLVMEVEFADLPGSSLFLSLADTNLVEVATNLYGNLMLGGNELVRIEMPVPLAANAAAAIIRLHRGTGEIAVYDVVLRELTAQMEAILYEGDLGGEEMGLPLPGNDTLPTGSETDGVVPDSSGTDQSVLLSDENSPEDLPADGTNGAPVAARLPSPSNHGIIYVDQKLGDDRLLGFSPTVGTVGGPKRTIAAGIRAAVAPADRLIVRSGAYGEDLDIAGKDINVYLAGKVDLSAKPDPIPVFPVGISTNY